MRAVRAFSELSGMDNSAAVMHLTSHRGIGAWTADTSCFGGWVRLDVFPRNDSERSRDSINGLNRLTLFPRSRLRRYFRAGSPLRDLFISIYC